MISNPEVKETFKKRQQYLRVLENSWIEGL